MPNTVIKLFLMYSFPGGLYVQHERGFQHDEWVERVRGGPVQGRRVPRRRRDARERPLRPLRRLRPAARAGNTS